jgi:hypothetical protein
MTKISALFVALSLAVTASTGCRLVKATPKADSPATASLRNNAYSLLYQLLNQEKDVSKLLIIKRASPQIHQLIKSISSASASGADQLKQFAKQDPSLTLKNVGLPAGEVSVRDAISSTVTKELLLTSGEEFELNLLLTQAEALNYGWHLAAVAAENDSRTERARYLQGLSEEMKSLHHRVVSLIALRRAPGLAALKSGVKAK